MGRLLGVPEFMLVILYLIFNQISNPIRVRTVATLWATLFSNASERQIHESSLDCSHGSRDIMVAEFERARAVQEP
jgi:hypothetical protein